MKGFVQRISELISGFLFGDELSSTLSKNIIISFFAKGYALVIQFALVPITLKYLNSFNYGIWLVLASMLEWLSYFDIGIQHGLRNRLTEALALNDTNLAKKYVSTAYFIITLIFGGFMLIFLLINPFINWTELLNIPSTRSDELFKITNLVFTFFCLRFILSLVTAIMFAKQQSSMNNMIGPIGSTISLLAILLTAQGVKDNLFGMSLIFSGSPVLVLLLFSLILFRFAYKEIRPSLSFVDLKHTNTLLNLGFSFFIIQVSMLIVNSTSSLILSHYFGPAEVTNYNIAFKYFTIPFMVSSIITLPYWSGFTDAFTRGEVEWIKRSMFKLNIVSWLLIFSQVILFIFSEQLIRIWTGDVVKISSEMKILLMIYSCAYLIINPYIIFINGVSKIRLQLITAIISIIITIPTSLIFIKLFHFGPVSVMVSTLISMLPAGMLWIIQYKKIISGTATGVWSK